MNFAGLYFTRGGWIAFDVLLIVLFASLCLTLFYAVKTLKGDEQNEDRYSAVLVLTAITLVLCLFVFIFVRGGLLNQRVYDDLVGANHSVVSVASSSNVATILVDGERLRVDIYKSPTTGDYTAYLLCPVDVSYASDDAECISRPE